MDRLTCSQCGKEIFSRPCPHCGSNDAHINVRIVDAVGMNDDLAVTIVKGSSELTIEKDGIIYPASFHPGVYSSEIVTASLDNPSLSQATPLYVRAQLIQNINNLERFVGEHPTEETTEHSFTLNLGIIKYQYKRGTKKKPGKDEQ